MNDKSNQPFSIRKRIQSFSYALRGIRWLLSTEHNARIHLLALILVVVAGFYFGIEPLEWVLVILVSGFVFSAEAFNSSLEYLADEVSEQHRERIGKSKDLAAAAVLIAAIAALFVGGFIFLPRFIALFSGI